MALSRLRSFKDSTNIISQFNNYSGGKQYLRKTVVPVYLNITKTVNFHLSNVRHYPNAPQLTLPRNVIDIFGNETGRFTPERARDIAEPVLLYGTGSADRQNQRKTWDIAEKWSPNRSFHNDNNADIHINSYDCFGAISLHSSMQTTVPKPFCSEGKSTNLNMPGGQWSLEGKYIAAEIIQKSYYTVLKQRGNLKLINNCCCILRVAEYSTSSSSVQNKNEKSNDETTLTNAQKLKRAVKDYGKTVFIFHISISLVSLGIFYLLVSSGLDITAIIKMMPGSSEKLETIMANSSTFLIAYAIHKVFAPVRISITLTATPFIVRYLRKVGILKKPS